MNTTTNAAVVVTVTTISDKCEAELLAAYRNIHHLTLCHLNSQGVKPTFMEDFAECNGVDFKAIHASSRKLLSAKAEERFEKRIGGVRAALQGVCDTYLAKARSAKAQIDSLPLEVRSFMPAWSKQVVIPMSELVGCFPQGVSSAEIQRDLRTLNFTVGQSADKSWFITIPFTAEKVEVETEAVA